MPIFVYFCFLIIKKTVFKKETEYALRGLVYIQIQNQLGKRPGILEIASEIDTPPSFTAKILQRMVRLGFIESVKGKNGGYYFDPEKEELSLVPEPQMEDVLFDRVYEYVSARAWLDAAKDFMDEAKLSKKKNNF